MKNWKLHAFYLVVIVGLQLINLYAVGYTQHKSDWCDGFYEEYRKGLWMKDTLALVLMVFGIVSCDSREISSTLICKDSSFLDGTEFKYTYLMQKGISKLKGGLKVLSDMNYPQEILDNAK